MHTNTETHLRALHQSGDLEATASLAIETYGRELLRFLHVISGDETRAHELFSIVAEKLWRGLAGFAWRSSLRTWLYRLARNAHIDTLRSARARPTTHLSEQRYARVVERVRTATQPWLRTHVRDWVTRIRSQLEPDEQSLLTLRVDQQMSYSDIADILADAPLDAPTRRREAARLRKRFSRLLEQIRDLAHAEGVLGSASPSKL